MSVVIRHRGRSSVVVGWLLIGMGAAGLAVFVILAMTLQKTTVLVFLFAPVLLFLVGGILNLWIGRRERLEIRPDRVIWCGFLGSPRSLAWKDVRQILMPPPGGRAELVAVAQLRDGHYVEIEALWVSPTAPASLLGGPDLARARQALIEGHRAYLAQEPRGRL